MTTHPICDACETVKTCSAGGCIPLTPISLAPSVGCSGRTVERCQCGYPQPCSINVPVTLCRAHARAATGETS
jgi:hypothetical protein